MRPAEFWALHPREFWWLHQLYEKKRVAETGGYAGMSEAEVEQIYRETYGEPPLAYERW